MADDAVRHDFSLRLAHTLTSIDLAAVLGDDMVAQRDPETPGSRIWVRRVAPSTLDAMLAAIRDLDLAGAPPVGAVDEDLVTVDDIAARLGRSRTAVRLWATVSPGRGRFPAPAAAGPPATYRWAEVAEWLRVWLGLTVPGHEPVVTAVDLALRLRALAPRLPRIGVIRDLVPRGRE
ncbi:hypothetical protein GCM10009682_29920 [Luedemannella flava]|uniref:DNA-binding protein n=1 Tax=Luedemannella flava TaxID=349316 RepID=A0ABP4Y9B0_9ACTN